MALAKILGYFFFFYNETILMNLLIKHLTSEHLPEIVQILNYYIKNTAITFDTEPYTTETRKPWFEQFGLSGRYQCLVAIEDGQIAGYANSSPFRAKRAYDPSIEVSIYLRHDLHSKGVGTALYTELFNRIKHENVHRAHALITLPNDKSINLHKKFGFTEVGTLNEAGQKLGQYHSVYLMEKKF